MNNNDSSFHPKNHEQLKVYNNQAQLTLQVDQTKKNYHTIRMEASRKQGDSYDHQNKLSLQVSKEELPKFIATLMGWHQNLKGNYHGEDKVKGYELINKSEGIMVRLYSKEFDPASLMLTSVNAFELCALAIRQLVKNHPGMKPAEVMAILRSTVGRIDAK